EAEEPRRRDANDLEVMPVERDRAADDRRVASVFALPEAVAEDGCGGAPALVVGGGQQAPGGGAYAERAEEPTADEVPVDGAGTARLRQVELFVRVRERTGEDVLPIAQLLPERVGQLRVAVVAEGHPHQLTGLGHGEGAQHDGVDQAE